MTYNVPDVDVSEEYAPERNLIFTNTGSPSSTLVCGSEEAGTSHSLICTLENLLLPDSPAHVNPRASAGVVFHFDEGAGDVGIQPCKAAYLCSNGLSVRILVSRSNFRAMHKLYATMPGLGPDVPRPRVIPLQLQQEQLSVSRLATLMRVIDGPPGLKEVVYRVLREMSLEDHHGWGIDYLEFKSRLTREELDDNQRRSLQERLWFEAFLADSEQSRDGKVLLDELFAPTPGTLTVVDLTCPFTSKRDACALFSVCLSVFAEGRAQCGRVVAVDGAHKFLNQSRQGEKLTDQLVSVMSKQQQLGIHTIVATQEPTLDPRLLNLFDVKVVHRFNSPAKARLLQDHLTGAAVHPEPDLFRDTVCLQNDQALIFCPTARIHLKEGTTGQHAAQLKTAYIRVKIRPSFTAVSEDEFMASSEPDEGEVLDFGPIRQLDTCPSNSVPSHAAVKSEDNRPRLSDLAPASRQMMNHLQQASTDSTVLGSAPPATRPVRPRGPTPVQAASARFTADMSNDHLTACLRSETTNLLRQNPKSVSFQDVRTAAATAAGVQAVFFNDGKWRNLSKKIIHDQIDAFINAYHIPRPKFG